MSPSPCGRRAHTNWTPQPRPRLFAWPSSPCDSPCREAVAGFWTSSDEPPAARESSAWGGSGDVCTYLRTCHPSHGCSSCLGHGAGCQARSRGATHGVCTRTAAWGLYIDGATDVTMRQVPHVPGATIRHQSSAPYQLHTAGHGWGDDKCVEEGTLQLAMLACHLQVCTPSDHFRLQGHRVDAGCS